MLGRELDAIAHIGVARSSIKSVALRLRSLLFIKQQERSVSIHWVRGSSKDAVGTAVNPNYEASDFGHCCISVGRTAPLAQPGPFLTQDHSLDSGLHRL